MNDQKNPSFTVVRRAERAEQPTLPPVLDNLLRDTSTPVLVHLAERYGLKRVPGLARQALIERLLRHLSAVQLEDLTDDLIAARYGGLSVEDLLAIALEADTRGGRRARPRLDDMPAADAMLIEAAPGRWVYTMHGYDVRIDLQKRRLACGCAYFRFAARRGALCKHLARAFTLIPGTYAREGLINLLVSRGYGGPDTPRWRFESLDEAA